mgnify:CR=1 FL=1
MKKYFSICLVNILLLSSCKSQDKKIIITPSPVFSEVDTFEISLHKKPFSKDDYFLVSGSLRDKQKLRNAINSFVKSNYYKECGNYGNYTMLFYRRSSAVNERTIQNRDSIYRYRVFLYNRDKDCIAFFDCWNSIPSDSVNFQPKYK